MNFDGMNSMHLVNGVFQQVNGCEHPARQEQKLKQAIARVKQSKNIEKYWPYQTFKFDVAQKMATLQHG